MYKYVKKSFDFLFALVSMIVLIPVFIIVSIAIKCTDGGPVFFKQQRPGKNGKIFSILKFRTMSVKTTDENGNELSDFDRMTKVGKFLRRFSLDELPQLINILHGEMSLIGPRPLLPEYLPLYTPQQMRRHEVAPGITGLAQVNGRNTLDWDERFYFDVYYVDHFNAKLDFIIFLASIKKIIVGEGVNSRLDITMEKFKGKDENKEVTR